MRWHESERSKNEGVLRHPADGESWKDFDKKYPDFAQEPRNVRLGLATDGFNPYGNMSNSYSMWPVIIVPYNFPPWRCMKETNMIMSLLIPSPKAPGKDFDVFMRPLVDELKMLWEVGVDTYDAYTKSMFRMRAAITSSSHDYPAFQYISGWSTKGYKACYTCNEETPSTKIRSKIAYVGHRHFLPINETALRKSRQFNGEPDYREPPMQYTGEIILRQLEKLPEKISGKHKNFGGIKVARSPTELNWSKKSILYELPYWYNVLCRHNLDVMHIEKNVCDSLLGTLLSIDGKSKDTTKARLDLEDLNIRKELHIFKDGNRWKKPQASYTLSSEERKIFVNFIKSVRFSDNFAANLSKNVSESDGKIHGLKYHDCHIIIQRLLPAAIRPFLNKETREALFDLSKFFQQICARKLVVKDLEVLQHQVVLLLCKLERIFPPAFFDIMVHLMLHLPREALLGGPVHTRWMYPFERMMKVYKQYVRNRARPEGSIAEGYIVNEALTFCSMYLKGIESKFCRPERHQDTGGNEPAHQLSMFQRVGRPLGKKNVIMLDSELRLKAEWYVLNNSGPQMQKYLE